MASVVTAQRKAPSCRALLCLRAAGRGRGHYPSSPQDSSREQGWVVSAASGVYILSCLEGSAQRLVLLPQSHTDHMQFGLCTTLGPLLSSQRSGCSSFVERPLLLLGADGEEVVQGAGINLVVEGAWGRGRAGQGA